MRIWVSYIEHLANHGFLGKPVEALPNWYAYQGSHVKGIVTDSNNIFLWHESEDINKKSLFPKFQVIPSSNFQVMHDYVRFIAPID